MENFFLTSLMSNMYSAVEWPTVLLFFGIGVLYFLAPLAGYSIHSRGRLAAGMWFLVVKMGLGLLRVVLLNVQMIESPNMRMDPNSSTIMGVQLIFPVLEMVVFLMAMVMFVLALQTMTRRQEVH
jgi:hypothetical protein